MGNDICTLVMCICAGLDRGMSALFLYAVFALSAEYQDKFGEL